MQKDLEYLSNINQSSENPWDSMNFLFASTSHSLEEEVESVRKVGSVKSEKNASSYRL